MALNRDRRGSAADVIGTSDEQLEEQQMANSSTEAGMSIEVDPRSHDL
jgi:hypothetical protein